MIKEGWQEAFKLVEKIADKYDGGVLYDYETAKSWDAGQAVCREAYGPDWKDDQKFLTADEAEKAPQDFINAAKRLLKRKPAWAKKQNEMEKKLLEIRLQMEVLITQREGMIALNKQREHRGESMAFDEVSFCEIADEFAELEQKLREA